MNIHPHVKQIATFCAVGAINTLIDLGILNLLFVTLGSGGSGRYALYKSVSFIVAATNSYFLNKHVTFSSKDHSTKTFLSFFVVTVLSFIINVSAAWIIFEGLSSASSLSAVFIGNMSAIAGTAAAFILNFLGYKFFVFKK